MTKEAIHDLRSQLSIIIGFSELLSNGTITPSSPKYKESLHAILSAARHALHLIEQRDDQSG